MKNTKTVALAGLIVNVPQDAEVDVSGERYLPSIHVVCYRGVYQIIAHEFIVGKVDFSMALGSQDRADIVNHSLDKTISSSEELQAIVDAAEFLLQR